MFVCSLSCLRLFVTPMDCSPPDSSVHGIYQARILKWVAISSSRDLPDPGIKSLSPALAGGFFTTEPPGKPLIWSSLFCYSSTVLQKNIFHFCYNCFFSQLNVTENSVKTLGSIKSLQCNLTLSLPLTITVVLD